MAKAKKESKEDVYKAALEEIAKKGGHSGSIAQKALSE